MMKLSNETVGVLKNFSAINSNIVIQNGDTIRTISEAKNILAKAKVQESFETGFGIYDLNEFLSAYSMFKDPDIVISGDNTCATIKEGKSSVKYFFSDPSILTSPAKDLQLPSVDVSFKLSQDDMASIRRASSALGVSDVVIVGEAGQPGAVIRVTDHRDSTANSYELELDNVQRSDESFKVVFDIANFKFLPSAYTVEISSKLVSKFSNEDSTLEYFVALEKSSNFGG